MTTLSNFKCIWYFEYISKNDYVLVAMLAVGIPMAWGFFVTIQKALALF